MNVCVCVCEAMVDVGFHTSVDGFRIAIYNILEFSKKASEKFSKRLLGQIYSSIFSWEIDTFL